MVDRGADERQTERDVHSGAEAGVFENRQALVVIHRQHGIAGGMTDAREQRVGGQRADELHAFATQAIECGLDDVDFLAPEVAGFAGMRIEPGHQDVRPGDAELALQVRVQDADHRIEQRRGNGVGHLAQRQMGGGERHAQAAAG